MKISVVVPGLFHYRYYIEKWQELGFLEKFYFSHKIQGNNSQNYKNIFIKEYAMYAMIRLLGAKRAFSFGVLYGFIWDVFCRLFYNPSRFNLVLMQGVSLRVMRKIKNNGGLIIGEAVNVHPREMYEILTDDAVKHGASFHWSKATLKNKVAEIDYVDYLLAPSRFVAESYERNGFPASKIIVIPYGVEKQYLNNNDSFCKSEVRASPLEQRKIKIICVGQVFPRKGQFHLLSALAEYGDEINYSLDIVGVSDPAYLAALRNIGIKFNYIPPVSHSRVLDLVAASDVLVLASLEDGFGMVVAEALSVNTPVAVSKYAGVSELIEGSSCGFVFDPFDYRSIVFALNKAASLRDVSPRDVFISWDQYAIDLRNAISRIDMSLQKERIDDISG